MKQTITQVAEFFGLLQELTPEHQADVLRRAEADAFFVKQEEERIAATAAKKAGAVI